ncbi:dipeptide/oligopeptide/nickel ABC transporter ATP-binding protein [Dermabacter vaginalis]|uniref:ABC transporter ATP-binding protein n=1 Tax=Dermabacter TaxID=36739 RepID=UPI001293FDC3|nr:MULTISPECIES: dipeptide/oligopeptide/nickel ABC transporter ATP-binding protein [Dermabacter]MCG7443931.1 dipeptide/oligopeptide/nickel ABC transporter ATP-binding protein [Dermabacter vaginalis]MCT2149937.1 dipeptide/oligopeptide/nickel ABC transporter ATP-binding protein [Dermabacter vaginalis]
MSHSVTSRTNNGYLAPDLHEPPVLDLQDIHVVHTLRTGSILKPDTIRAVDGISVQVRRGEVIGIVGESGSGKSTLANVMLGLQQPTSGKVLFKGNDLRRSRAARRERGRAISVVFQDPSTALNPRMIVQDTLMDPLRVHGIGTDRERLAMVKELMHLVGLPQSALSVLPRQISGGQRQRVAIARALALEPDIVIADEPTSALDVSVRAQVLNLLTDLKKELGLGLVFISHDINTVRFVSDTLLVMNRGKVVESGPSEEVFRNATDPYTQTLLAAAPALL